MTLEEYFNTCYYPEKIEELRAILQEVLPEAKEKISFQMPCFYTKRIILHYGSFKDHLSLFPGPEAIEKFKDRLQGYKLFKGTIKLSLNQPLDKNLIQDIALYCLEKAG